MTTAPRVTVLMSVYNVAPYVGAAIESILGQSFGDFHFVIYDDASCDGSRDVIARYRDPRIEVRTRAENHGLTRNLANGVARARGIYIARMDADDIALEGRFAAQVAHLDAHREIDVLGTGVFFFDDHREVPGDQPAHHDDIALELFFDFTMMHPTVMMRRDALVAHRWNYDPHFTYSQDFDLWSRMIGTHRFANLPARLLMLREHPRKISREKRCAQQRFTEEIRQRQIRRLCPDANGEECALFSCAARGDAINGRVEFDGLHRLLLRLIEANRRANLYPVEKFERRAAGFFRETCRRMLKSREPAAAAFWRSELRGLESLTVRQTAAMTYFTLRALVGATSK